MASAPTSERRELAFAGVARQAELVRSGDVSPRELVETALERIERLDPQLNAFRVVFAERALLEADQAAGRAGNGDTRPLLGVPIAVKDDTPVAGEVRTMGSTARTTVEPADAELVQRLRAAGAIVLGIARTPELCAWPFTETAAGGITRNPWNPQHTSGGSSGGPATAVAAGLVAASTASDGAGSIRIPSACCGLFGLKATRGLVSTAPLGEIANGLSVFGFLARTVADTALLYEVATANPYAAAAAADPGKLRIALSLKLPPGSSARLHPDWRRAAEETAGLLRSLGHEVIERDPKIGMAGIHILTRYVASVHGEASVVEHPERLERRTRSFARMGKVAHRRLAAMRAAETRDAARINAIFDDVDVVLGPTLARSALPVGRYDGRGAAYTLNGITRWAPFNGIWNHLGNPAAAVPAGFDPAGLPLSVQLVGAHGSEAMLFSLGGQIERARPWAGARPPVS